MRGPSKNDRRALGQRLKRRQFWADSFAWLVGIGLLVEYWNEIVDCFVNRHPPSLPLIGGLLVTLGVLGEVLFGHLVLITSDKIQARADSDVAQANKIAAESLERAGKAEQSAAEANLARVEMESRLVRLTINRHLTDEEIEALRERLKPFAGQPFVVTFAPTDDAATMEPLFFSSQLREVLERAGWVWAGDNIPLAERVGRGVLIECNDGHQRAAFALQKALSDVGIAAKASWIEHVELPQLTIHVGLV